MGAMASRPEPNDRDEAFDRLAAAFSDRSKLVARKTKRSASVFAVSIGGASMFLKGMPFHLLFRPWGQILLMLAALAFAVALFDVAILIGDRLNRRKLDREISALDE
jgi:hypothetical protein